MNRAATLSAEEASVGGFKILGPLKMSGARGEYAVRAGRQRTILATLLLQTNHLVSFENLIDTVWGEDPPGTARSQIHICISAIRRKLSLTETSGSLRTLPKGYQLDLEVAQLDAQRFAEMVQSARPLQRGGNLDRAARTYRSALSLWRGDALEDVDSEALLNRKLLLNNGRLETLEECLKLEQVIGDPHEVIGELARHVAAYPLREQLREQLMVALYRTGRRTEALDTYQSGERELAQQLGVPPSRHLQRLRRRIVDDDSILISEFVENCQPLGGS